MTKILKSFVSALVISAAAPAMGQTLLLDVSTTVPLAAVLDNACTPELETIAFQGTVDLSQRVWLTPDGLVRLQVAERTAMQGVNTSAGLLGSPKYTFDATGQRDLEFDPVALGLVMFKKVVHPGLDDFHALLVLDFDPQNLQLKVSLEGACDNGQP